LSVIETVLGPIPADRLGITSMHDHVLSDASALRCDGATPAPSSDKVVPETLDYLRWNMLALGDNLRLDEPDVAVVELGRAVALGQAALVEATSWGLGPDHAGLPDVARRSGMTIVCSYGAYIRRTLPAWLETTGLILEKENHSYDTEGWNGTNVRPPVYIGKNVRITDSEIGPNVSIEDGAVIENCVITDTIIQENAVIRYSKLEKSTVGNYAEVEGLDGTAHLGDHSVVKYA
jgi:predicted metal-dependent phosphotriesterase family hydrolase